MSMMMQPERNPWYVQLQSTVWDLEGGLKCLLEHSANEKIGSQTNARSSKWQASEASCSFRLKDTAMQLYDAHCNAIRHLLTTKEPGLKLKSSQESALALFWSASSRLSKLIRRVQESSNQLLTPSNKLEEFKSWSEEAQLFWSTLELSTFDQLS